MTITLDNNNETSQRAIYSKQQAFSTKPCWFDRDDKMLLRTKMLVPRLKHELLVRPTVFDKIDAVKDKGLAVICAPPGYGKTTAVCQWLQQQQSNNYCWLSVDKRDNDPVNFWLYVQNALSKFDEKLQQPLNSMLGSIDHLDLYPAIDTLISALIEYSRTWKFDSNRILVLDDLHEINNPDILEQLDYFISYSPDWLKVIITTRYEPKLNLSVRRVREEVSEIASEDLRLSKNEFDRYLSQRLSLQLNGDLLEALYNKTEGWMAAVQLAGLNLQKRQDSESFVNAFSGHEKLLASYLMSEVFAQQSSAIKELLLLLSIVPRFNSDLVRLFTNTADDALLDELKRLNLLLISLDSENHWFRFHDLFREWLSGQIKRMPKDKLHKAHEIAADWYLEQQSLQEAIEQYAAIECWRKAAEYAGKLMKDLACKGQFTIIQSIVNLFPEAFVKTQPKLSLMSAFSLLNQEQFDACKAYLKLAEKALQTAKVSDQENNTLIGILPEDNIDELMAICLFMQGQLYRLDGKIEQSQALNRQLYKMVPDTSDMYSWTLIEHGADSFCHNQLGQAENALQNSVEIAKQNRDLFCISAALPWLAPTHIHMGKLQFGQQYIESLNDWLVTHHHENLVNHSPINYCRGLYLLEQNELSQAFKCHNLAMQPKSKKIETVNQIYLKFQAYNLFLAFKDLSSASKVLDEIDFLFTTNFQTWDFVIPKPETLRAIIQLIKGNPMPIMAWSHAFENNPDKSNYFRYAAELVLYAKTLLFQGREVTDIVAEIRESAGQHNILRHIQADLVLAYQAHRLENQGETKTFLESALARANDCGFKRSIANEGLVIKPLLEMAIQENIEKNYASEILRIQEASITPPAPDLNSPKTKNTPRIVHNTAGPDALSQREVQVISLINEGLSNKAIANEISISPTTVKTHIRNIYSKLGVNRRTQALAKARIQGLL